MSSKRSSPYRDYPFQLKWNGRTVAAFKKVTGLGDPVTRKGDDAAAGDGRDWTAFEAITLERGVTHDAEFEWWANQIWEFASSRSGISLRDLRRDVTIEQRDAAGQVVLAANLTRCWVSDFQALPDLDASAKAVAIQMMKLEHEGWE